MIIKATDLTTKFGDRVIHDGLNFHVNEAEIYGLLGGSGTGKSTLMKTMIYLKEPSAGKVEMLGRDLWSLDEAARREIKLACSVMFQFGALYTSMNVLENIYILLKEYSRMSERSMREIAMFWLQKVGLSENVALQYPSELSGGMKKRVAMARALVLSPKILFLDEPNSGLDPSSARAFDELVVELRDTLGVTVVMVTHDIDSICMILDRFLILQDKKIAFEGTFEQLMQMPENPLEELLKTRKNGGK
ncbi:ABC transporter, ATP-binding protein [Campylobacter rectus RM3267]|uniref:Lipid asymmetry ABC transporter MlaABCDEF, ATPase component MlaF n=2 Tax=Campylobacter rectus TaxID=203 RepID=A0A6G5QMB5_CAMRE|nr:ATP-binding cassette domain-containing protein [Campylobacter rectus]EEF13630.1 ABC transporter, ATP-binding protein [Campylobacter rectus RM3267]QCD46848.1 lipid asymmetry ABC transporter MlaABCDEF, ATPase component MlaF [Campylobacter rectus]UEB47550.1 ATP-binding cassette domain-containing protein [Campylobacter rectus]